MTDKTNYKIPTAKKPSAWISLLVLIAPAIILGVVSPVTGAGILGGLLIVGAPLLIFTTMIQAGINRRRNIGIWTKHNFSWYRNSFPEHAHSNGNVSCRWCGSTKARVTNLMSRTFVRVHSCHQCGETLYFSKEQI